MPSSDRPEIPTAAHLSVYRSASGAALAVDHTHLADTWIAVSRSALHPGHFETQPQLICLFSCCARLATAHLAWRLDSPVATRSYDPTTCCRLKAWPSEPMRRGTDNERIAPG